MKDQRSIAVLDVAERHLRGEATDEELVAARNAADEAALAAATAAYAAWNTARGAARYAALAAAWGLVWDETWDAQRAWQREELERMLGEDNND